MRALALWIASACFATVSVAHGGPNKPPAPTPVKPPAAGKGPTANAKSKPPALAAAWAPPPYTAMVKKWHEPVAPKVDALGRPMLVLSSINGMGRVELPALTEDGGFSPLDLDRVSHLMRSSDGAEHPIHPRLLDVAYALQRHFHAGEVRFLSGFRTPKKLGSNHGYGRAIDLVIPGATDEEVAAFVRARGFVGVGIYPTSGFVHVDVRDRSFFWVDRSGPGKPNKTVGFMKGEAVASDVAAKKAGHTGTQPPGIGRDVDGALARLVPPVKAPPPATVDEDSLDDDDH